jgi:anaerobic carbon-monoxide dehydrogenase iron sulfur subunit
MATIRIKINRNLCSGCLSCMTTCSMANESYTSPAAARIQVRLHPFGTTHEIVLCRQCTRAHCLEACPEHAITRDERGALAIDVDRCTGCRACIDACPFEAVIWNPIAGEVAKCELCGGDVPCIEACPTGALAIRIMRHGSAGREGEMAPRRVAIGEEP